MANQAAKKAKRESEALRQNLLQWIIPIHAFFILYRILWQYQTFTSNDTYAYGVLVLITYTCFHTLISSAKEGSSSEYAMDVFVITLAVQLGVAFSNYFYYLFLVIPAYLIYCGVQRLLTYVFTPDPEEETAEEQASAAKKQEKKARRAGKSRVIRR